MWSEFLNNTQKCYKLASNTKRQYERLTDESLRMLNEFYDKYSSEYDEDNDDERIDSKYLDDSGQFIISNLKIKPQGNLPSGIYTYVKPKYGSAEYLETTELRNKQEVLDIGVVSDLKQEVFSFIKQKELYKDLQLFYKRGVLLYGPPGTGKTSVINKLVNELTLDNILIIYTSQVFSSSYLYELSQDSRFKLILFEEFTETVKSTDSNELLSFLDGESSIDNCFFIATTNYIDKLPENLANRPGRFDKFFYVGYLSEKDIKTYFNNFNIELNQNELDLLCKTTLAQFKEIVLLVKRNNSSVLDAINLMHNHQQLFMSHFKQQDRSDEDNII